MKNGNKELAAEYLSKAKLLGNKSKLIDFLLEIANERDEKTE
jgi:hypothetical protein